MHDKSNPFLKSHGEIDFGLEANLRVINSDMGRNRPKDYQIQDEEFEISLRKDSEIYDHDELNNPGRIFSNKGLKKDSDWY